MTWFDSHCHLDASEFSEDIDQVVERAVQVGLKGLLIPAVQAKDFQKVIQLCERYKDVLPQICFTLGIHPLYTNEAIDSDLQILKDTLNQYADHPRLVGVGEIGLDYFVTHLDDKKQEFFFEEQLYIAKDFQLPVIIHVRKSQDQILKRLRKIKVSGGIAHAFNGSQVQANHFLKLNFKLGFGGTVTHPRSLQIRRLATELSIDSFVLETDAPDIPPLWLLGDVKGRNEPQEIPKIAECFADLRAISIDQLAIEAQKNILSVLPRLNQLMQ
jgi:TatD DNase family protein